MNHAGCVPAALLVTYEQTWVALSKIYDRCAAEGDGDPVRPLAVVGDAPRGVDAEDLLAMWDTSDLSAFYVEAPMTDFLKREGLIASD